MPVPLWTTTHKAEAKYNVVTEFPQLGLHAAAASGNVGLVEYALKHGQPINSVLDGVLPIHAAAAGGHPQVVKKLIEHGADVNARRIPRRYFSDKNRDSSAPIVGTTDSTPLHFAAANGNTNVITLLLLHGAHPDRADKYGVTPEALARENNWVECADILHNWVLNKDRDLREREALVPNGNGAASASSIPPEPESPSIRRRLHVKQSIDTALNMLKSTSNSDPSLKPYPTVSATSPPASPMDGEFGHDSDNHTTSRRPSLPHTLQPPPTLDDLRSRNPTSSPCSRRPRSAGTGAERSSENEPVYLPHGRGGAGRKLGGKLSLLGLFKKAQHAEGSDVSSTSTPPRLSSSSTPLPLTPSTTSLTKTSPGSALEVLDPVELHRTHRNHSSGDSSARGLRINPPPPNGRLQPPSSFLELDSPITSSPTVRSPPPLPSALDLHNVLAGKRPQGRDRSRSNATTVSTLSDVDSEDEQAKLSAVSKTFKPMLGNRDRSGSSTAPAPNLPDIAENRPSGAPPAEEEKGLYPPGILKGHRRSSSNSQSSPSPGRALRFDSAPDRPRKEIGSAGSSSNQVPQLKGSSSSQSLRPSLREDSRVRSSPRIHVEQSFAEEGSPPANSNFDGYGGYQSHTRDEVDDDEDSEYLPTSSQTDLKSFEPAASSTLPPLFGDPAPNTRSLASICENLPFSIRQPPPMTADSPENSLKVIDPDRRGRGDSISSTCTANSTNGPQYSTSGSTIGSSASPMLSTPNGGSLPLPSAKEAGDVDSNYEGVVIHEEPPKTPSREFNGNATLIQRRAQSPLDIDIRDISSHAEADALVEKNKQEILAFASSQTLTSGSTLGGDTTPLSARLAAYGESLALQKRLKEREAEVLAQAETPPSPIAVAPPKTALDFHRHGVARQSSLGKPAPSRTGTGTGRKKDPRRPSTADGLSSRKGGFFTADSAGSAKSFTAASRPPLSSGSTSFEERRQLLPPSRGLATSLSANTSLFSPPEALMGPASARAFAVQLEDDLEGFASDSLASDAEPSPVIRHVASFTSAGARKKPVPGINAGSAKKLNRMGFTVVDQTPRPVVAPPPAPPPSKLRGGLKSIMQTFKGKT